MVGFGKPLLAEAEEVDTMVEAEVEMTAVVQVLTAEAEVEEDHL
jgi:hypothetical protein